MFSRGGIRGSNCQFISQRSFEIRGACQMKWKSMRLKKYKKIWPLNHRLAHIFAYSLTPSSNYSYLQWPSSSLYHNFLQMIDWKRHANQ